MGTELRDTLAVPLDGLREAEIRIAFGGGELAIGTAAPGLLLSGTGEGRFAHRFAAPGSLKVEPAQPPGWPGVWRPLRWDIGVTAEIPVRLRLETGAIGPRSTLERSGFHGWSCTRVRRSRSSGYRPRGGARCTSNAGSRR